LTSGQIASAFDLAWSTTSVRLGALKDAELIAAECIGAGRQTQEKESRI
jgi:DNA-binding transcriptional ArsR family regulator